MAAKAKAKKSVKKSTASKEAVANGSTAKPGVIATIVETISRSQGASMNELVAILSKKFPDRKPDSMRKTCGIQANANAKKKDRDEKRGLVYYGTK